MTEPADNRVRSPAERISELRGLTLRSEREGDVHTLRLEGELDIVNCDEIERELKRIQNSDASRIVVDLSALRFIDSTGIRLLLTAHARAQSDAHRLTLIPGPRSVQRVFEICGVRDMLPFAD